MVFFSLKKRKATGEVMDKVFKELRKVIHEFPKNKWKEIYEEIKNNYDYYEYSNGGAMSHFGIYQQEPFMAKVCANLKLGIKAKVTDENNINFKSYFKYYFKDNKLIASEKYLSGGLYFINFHFYGTNEKTIITIEPKRNEIRFVAKCFYDDSHRIVSYYQSFYDVGPLVDDYQILNYQYEGDKIIITQTKVWNATSATSKIRNEKWELENKKLTFITKW